MRNYSRVTWTWWTINSHSFTLHRSGIVDLRPWKCRSKPNDSKDAKQYHCVCFEITQNYGEQINHKRRCQFNYKIHKTFPTIAAVEHGSKQFHSLTYWCVMLCETNCAPFLKQLIGKTVKVHLCVQGDGIVWRCNIDLMICSAYLRAVAWSCSCVGGWAVHGTWATTHESYTH